jgi:SAM-dependent methyltransferase
MTEATYSTPIKLDERATKYLEDLRWVQEDILMLPNKYPKYEVSYCEVFSSDIVNRRYSTTERKGIEENLLKLHKILQGPFWLGEDLVVGGFWNVKETVRSSLGKICLDLSGKRVLEIGCMSGYQSFYMNLKKPQYYLAIEPSGYFYQADFLNSIYNTNINFKQWFWQDIPEELNGTFDLVLNCGILYHEFDPVSLIKKTTDLLKHGGKTIVATTVIKDERYKDYIKYMPDVYAGDMTYWFVIGENALMRLYKSFGCEGKLIMEAGSPGDSGSGKTVEGYDLEKYNFYEFKKVSEKSRPIIVIPRY